MYFVALHQGRHYKTVNKKIKFKITMTKISEKTVQAEQVEIIKSEKQDNNNLPIIDFTQFDVFNSKKEDEKLAQKVVEPLTPEQEAVISKLKTDLIGVYDYNLHQLNKKNESNLSLIETLREQLPTFAANCKHESKLEIVNFTMQSFNPVKIAITFNPVTISETNRFQFIERGESKDAFNRSLNHAKATKAQTTLRKCFADSLPDGLIFDIAGSEFYEDSRIEKRNALKVKFEAIANGQTTFESDDAKKIAIENLLFAAKQTTLLTGVITEKS